MSNFKIAITELGLLSAVESVICFHRESKAKQYACKLIDRLIEYYQESEKPEKSAAAKLSSAAFLNVDELCGLARRDR